MPRSSELRWTPAWLELEASEPGDELVEHSLPFLEVAHASVAHLFVHVKGAVP